VSQEGEARGLGRMRRYPGTVALALALVLGWGVIGASDLPWLEASVRAGGLQPLRVAQGELFRLVMPLFLHAHPAHLVLNGLALVQLGILTEEFFGVRRLLVAFFWCGVAGSLASALFTSTPYVVSVGASGAILGLAGLLLGTSWFGSDGVAAELDELLGRRLLGGVGATLAFGFALCLVSPVVDNWAHIGGLLCGLALSQAWAEPDLLVAEEDEAEGEELLPTDPPNERAVDLLTLATGVLVFVSVAWTALAGGQALRTFHLEAARTFAERASTELASPWWGSTWETPEVLAQMLDAYDDAQARPEGEEVFDRAVGRIEDPWVAGVTASALDRSAGAGRDRDRAQIVLGERWLVLAPADPTALNYLAWNLVVAKDTALRDPARAEVLAREALARIPEPVGTGGCAAYTDVSRQMTAGTLDTHAEALYQLGRYDEAAAAQTEAVAMARELELEALAEMEARDRKIARARKPQ
jgi:membrane associated rhomboid family serine protease